MKGGARHTALDVLLRIEQSGAFSNLMLNQTLQSSRLNRQDAALVTELVYGTLQRQNTIDYYLSRFVAKGVHTLQPWVRMLLRMSLYQLRYLDRIPSHAAVDEAVQIAKRRGHRGVAGLVNGVLRNAARNLASLEVPDTLPESERIALVHSHPEWLVERWLEQFGDEETARMCEENNLPPHISVRVNRQLTDRETMLAELRENGLEAQPSSLSEDGIRLTGRSGNLAQTAWYEAGRLTIQDESSMVVAAIVAAEPGMRVLDCCAAPGGKTTHIAETMDDQGEVWAGDIHEHKEALIRQQAKRLGLASIRTLVSDARQLADRFPAESFDRILLDAPCSGLGVIRRKPDIKWRKNEAEMAGLPELQYSLLEAVTKLLRPGGVLVYSTCTVERAENDHVVEQFLARNDEYEVDDDVARLVPSALHANVVRHLGAIRILPHHFGTDGFFIARLRKKMFA